MSVVVEPANILLRVVKQGHRWLSLLLVCFLSNKSVKRNIFKHYIENLVDCDDITTGYTKELTKNSVFRRDQVRSVTAKKKSCSTLNVKDMTEVFRKQVEFCRKEVSLFCPESENAFSRAASPYRTTEYIHTCCEEVKKKLM